MQRTLLLVLALLAAGFTGCLGGSEDPSGDGTGSQGNGPAAGAGGDVRNSTPLVYPGAQPVFELTWANGSFSIDQSDELMGPVREIPGQDPDNRRRLDITERVPAGVPTFVAVEINAEAGQGDVDIWLDAPDTAIWATDFDTPFGGYSRMENILVRPEGTPMQLVVQLDEPPDRAEVPYTLSIDVRSNPGLALPGAPVSFQAGPANTLELESLDEGGQLDVLLFRPDDTFLARVQGTDTATFAFEEDAPQGRYVLMVAEGIRPVWLDMAPAPGATVEDASLRVLTQHIEYGEPQQMDRSGSVAWSFEADRVPLQAGLLIEGGGASQDLEAALSGPSGEIFVAMLDGGPWVQPGFVFLTDMGDPDLHVGSYDAEVSFGVDASPGSQARSILVHYGR